MRVEFEKAAAGRRYRSLASRDDGVVVAFEGGSYNTIAGGEVPHDAAHLIVESELGLRGGVWGTIADGGLFKHVTVVSGRQRAHAGTRGRELVRERHVPIMQAELLVRMACDWTLARPRPRASQLRADAGASAVDALDDAALERCAARLADAGAAWSALGRGDTLRLDWPLD